MCTMSASADQLAAEVERLRTHLEEVRNTQSKDAVSAFAQYIHSAREPYHATHDEVNPWNSMDGNKPCCILQ